MKKISIIIVTYNSEKDIYDCVSSIKEHADLPWEELEVMVVDNNSKGVDAMFSRLRTLYGESIVLIKNTHNGGYGQGNNVGIAASTAPLIMIMNPDVRLVSSPFRAACKAFDDDTNLCMYGMKQMLTPTIPSRNSFTCTYMVNGYVQTFLTGLCTRLEWYLPRYMHFSGSCFFVRKSMFEEVGLFDESIFMYGEEDDIHYRLRQKGYGMTYNPKLTYIHLVKGRKPTLSYELKLVDVAIRQNEKKGQPARETIKNRIRNANVLIAREYIKKTFGKENEELLAMLKAFKQELLKRKDSL